MSATATAEALVERLVRSGTLTHATLSNPRRRGDATPARLTVRPVLVRGRLVYQWTSHFATRTASENLDPEQTERRLLGLLRDGYRQGLLHGPEADYQVLVSRSARVLERPATRPRAELEHDRRKRRLLEEGTPVPFLVELEVMTAEGKVRSRRYDKFRQVNRFLELVDDVVPDLPQGRPLRIVDFGCGRSYLTFALHHLLTAIHGREIELLGLDLKEDVIAECSALAGRLGCAGLRFEVGDIAGTEAEGVDLVVSLHACDTATDAALERAVRWDASVILAVPCCQHELLRQLQSAPLAPLLEHGVLRERFAAEVTDAARARLLELAGYRTQLVEFVDLEHTPKNVLIRAVRRSGRGPEPGRLAREYVAFRAALGISPWLERALADRIELPA